MAMMTSDNNNNNNNNYELHHHHHQSFSNEELPQASLLFQHPSYKEFLLDSYNYFHRNLYSFIVNQKPKNYFENDNFHRDLYNIFNQIDLFDIFLVIGLSILLTIGRHLMTKYVFIPITDICGIQETDAQKIPESSWKLCFYLFTWLTSSYYLFIKNKGEYFRDPTSVWHDYSIGNPVDGFIYVLYMTELSFYLHSLYTTLMVDQRRKDTNTLMFHHIVCVFLIFISYCNKSHKSGLVTLFLHDGCDILLEATKLIRYFKVQHGRTYESAEIFVNIGFACFLFTWLTNRLYWFPIKIIYVASIYVEQKQIPVPFITVLVAMLWIILLMNFYWFTFAIRLLYKVATGQINELEDNREFKDQEQTNVELVDVGKKGENIINQPQKKANNNETNEEQRKFSVDSGIVLMSTNVEPTEQNVGTIYGDVEDEEDHHQIEKNNDSMTASNTTLINNSHTLSSSSSSSSVYNLRQRKKPINFQVWN